MFPNRARSGTYIGVSSSASISNRVSSGIAGTNAVYVPALTFTIAQSSVLNTAFLYAEIQESVDGITWTQDNIIVIGTGVGSRTIDFITPVIGYYYRARLYDSVTQTYGAPSNSVQLTSYYVYESTYLHGGGSSPSDYSFTVPSTATRADFFIIAGGATGRDADNTGLQTGPGGGGGAYAKKDSAVVSAGESFYVRCGAGTSASSNSNGYIRRDGAANTSNQITVQGGQNPATINTAGLGGTSIASSGIFATLTDSRAGVNGTLGIDPVGVTPGTGGDGGASGAYADGVNRPAAGTLSTGVSADVGIPSAPTSYGSGGAGIGSNGVYDYVSGLIGKGGYVYVLYQAV